MTICQASAGGQPETTARWAHAVLVCYLIKIAIDCRLISGLQTRAALCGLRLCATSSLRKVTIGAYLCVSLIQFGRMTCFPPVVRVLRGWPSLGRFREAI